MAVTDLTNTKWLINSITCTAGYGQFSINLSIENDTSSYSYSSINIGYRVQLGGELIQSYADRVALTTINPEYDFDKYKELLANDIITITGGTDVTNASLISWLTANATLIIEPTTGGSISIGSFPINKVLFGTIELKSIYIGEIKLYDKETPSCDGIILDQFTPGLDNITSLIFE